MAGLILKSRPIDGQIGDVREDMVVHGISTKREKHEVAPLLIVGRRGFQNDRDHRSYVLDAGSLRVQVRSEDDIRVGAGVNEVIVIVVLGDRNPLGSGKLLL
jgi:hypothetical protein